MGMIGILHTWERNLAYHPHVHFLVPGGGLDENGCWRPPRHNFLLPVRTLSILFRAKFCVGLKQTPLWSQVPASVWQKPWVVNCKPVGTAVPLCATWSRTSSVSPSLTSTFLNWQAGKSLSVTSLPKRASRAPVR
ncbi:MAG: hypothetical protein D6816_13485 [Bacteroidetes bacterium]|nr:MAG: hypothetical protein D6816_13485 [Bacteroidota bacterium]